MYHYDYNNNRMTSVIKISPVPANITEEQIRN